MSLSYVMMNKENGAKIQCTEKYVEQWILRGFEVLTVIKITA